MSDHHLWVGIAPGRAYPGTWWDMVEFCLRHGFQGVEFKYELPFILTDRWSPGMVRRIASVQRDQGLRTALHGPYTNIGALLGDRWQAAVDEHLRALEWAEILGAMTYTVHPGWLEKKYATPDLVARCQENTAKALEQLVSQRCDVAICVENQNPAETEKIKCGFAVPQLHALVDGLPSVGFTLDLGHAQVLNGAPTRFFAELGPDRVKVAHVHDNDGTADNHLPPGQGTIDWTAFLSAYRLHGCQFPLFLELACEEDGFVKGKDFLERVWDDLNAGGRLREQGGMNLERPR